MDYSRSAFDAVRDDPAKLAELCRKLHDEVIDRLRPTLVELMQQIVDELNEQGHNLQPFLPPAGGEITYRDRGDGPDPVARLRLAHDSVVSVGFADFDPTG